MSVYRIYVEKKPQFAVEAQAILSDIKNSLGIQTVENVRVLNRYDVEDISQEDFAMAKNTIFSEPQVDTVTEKLPVLKENQQMFVVRYLPGQFDQRADSAVQCIQLAAQNDRPIVASARIYFIEGNITDKEFVQIKQNLINPVEATEASFELPNTLHTVYDSPKQVAVLDAFCVLDTAGLQAMIRDYGLAMDLEDIKFCQAYFRDTEKRAPTITEIRMIDTYWSDHCRHTTFSTQICEVEIQREEVADVYQTYLTLRETLYVGKNKPMTLMDLATIGAKALKSKGLLKDLDESEEINACSVKIKVDVGEEEQDWLLQFKNETHNHPTEIEPFGGAATCLGGAIRDPLSGRSYVYQAMRVTGAADPLLPFGKTLAGKLPQKKIVTTAAAGYSSYGNQIGLATGQVSEVYHPGYAAKRMEIGAVIGAVPADHVVREVPKANDIVILLGGKTGRDGCGGATGSSKSHSVESLSSCGAEVQKGNPPEERKIQRLFRDGNLTRLIKRCNDFGAGGVSVAIGELADGLKINLDLIPKKYDGLDGTELAISESQERMAVVVAPNDVDAFLVAADKENLLATVVAEVTEEPRLVMDWRGDRIVDLSREFLNSNGALKFTDIKINPVSISPKQDQATAQTNLKAKLEAVLSDLNVCCQKGLSDRFDSTIGTGTVVMPFGGIHQLTPAQAMVSKIPVIGDAQHPGSVDTETCSVMSWGFNPTISQDNPFKGAMLAVVESIAKIIASGGSRKHCWLTFQEYFEKLGTDSTRWGKPFQALLGALQAQLQLECAAIGGKDSMSGSFEDIHVPPTLVSFAVATAKTGGICTNEFKASGNQIWLILPKYDKNDLPVWESVRRVFDQTEADIACGKIKSAYTLGYAGIAEAICKMGFGNRLGFKSAKTHEISLFTPTYGGFLLETDKQATIEGAVLLGEVTGDYSFIWGEDTVSLEDIQKVWEDKLEPIYPRHTATPKIMVPSYNYSAYENKEPCPRSGVNIAQPRVLIPVFPGTNCEYDTAKAFESAGAKAEIVVIRNKDATQIRESVEAMRQKIAQANIIALPGGFSGGDEPEGSAKFITSFFRNPAITQAVMELLKNRDGLMCGICNGFQALVKLGLLPFGEVITTDETCPTLTFNLIHRHQSALVQTRIASNKSPWLMKTNVGDIHAVAISHGEGRFVASNECIDTMAKNGQIATQYVDLNGAPTLDWKYNPNASVCAIEGITSPDGKIFGKMAHSERFSPGLYQNVDGNKDQKMFQSAVSYFRD